MSFNQNDTVLVGATRIAIGTSTILKISAQPFQNSYAFKYLSGGSLEVCEMPIALTGASATGWGTGYLLGTNEAVGVNGPATYYLAASGATAVICMMISHTTGMTVKI